MSNSKQQQYLQIAQQIESITAGEADITANMANISAILYWNLAQVNWAGFYLLKQDELVLGPFHGQPACIRIPIGKGVCGTAVAENRTLRVEDVHQFSGHIACDAASNSEVVIPIRVNDTIVGVLDIDSPEIGRFDEDDQAGLEKIVNILEQSLLTNEV